MCDVRLLRAHSAENDNQPYNPIIRRVSIELNNEQHDWWGGARSIDQGMARNSPGREPAAIVMGFGGTSQVNARNRERGRKNAKCFTTTATHVMY